MGILDGHRGGAPRKLTDELLDEAVQIAREQGLSLGQIAIVSRGWAGTFERQVVELQVGARGTAQPLHANGPSGDGACGIGASGVRGMSSCCRVEQESPSMLQMKNFVN